MSAKFNRGGSRQDWQTPPALLDAIRTTFRVDFSLDAAASAENAICPAFYDGSEGKDGLTEPWQTITWCNPPYSHIAPWVRKASDEAELRGVESFLLVPASVGSNWWLYDVNRVADVYFLNGRITFVGAETPYPKDCAILHYRPPMIGGDYRVWSWNA